MNKKIIILFVFFMFFLTFPIICIAESNNNFYKLNRFGEVKNIENEKPFSHLMISDESLVLYMPFDINSSYGIVYDWSNFSNDGLLKNNPIFDKSGGKYKGTYRFDGNSTYIDLGINNRIPVENFSGWSSFAWVKYNPSNPSSYTQCVLGRYQLCFSDQGSRMGQLFHFDGTSSFYSSSRINKVNEWNHIGVSCDNITDQLIFYINGSNAGSVGPVDCDNKFLDEIRYIGARNPTHDFFNGSIDEVMVFNRVLSESEIMSIYNETYPRFYKSGEVSFNDLDLSNQKKANFSLENCSDNENGYLQGRINSGEWYNFSNCKFEDDSYSEDLSNLDFDVKLISKNRFFPFFIKGFVKDVSDMSIFSKKINLTFPPTNSSPYFDFNNTNYGASSNPSGVPIGGFVGYDRIISTSDATYYVNNVEELLEAVRLIVPGEIIYINDSVILDFTGYEPVKIFVENITIASGRGRNYSKGALIRKEIGDFNDTTRDYIFSVYSDNVRFSGLRFDGMDAFCNIEFHSSIFYEGRKDLEEKYYELKKVLSGIYGLGDFLEVDNCEGYGFTLAFVLVSGNAKKAYLHNNYMHNNCNQGLGYGVSVSNVAEVFIEANLFDKNRHSIESTSENSSYEASYNIQLPNTIYHDFDRHGNSGTGGNYTIIHHNSFFGTSQHSVGIRAPSINLEGVQIYNNVFMHDSFNKAIFTKMFEDGSPTDTPGAIGTNVKIFNNFLNKSGYTFYSNPVAVVSVSDYIVSVGDKITFDASKSYSDENSIRYVEWDFSEGGDFEYGEIIEKSFSRPGRYKISVTVYDQVGFLNKTSLSVIVKPKDPSKAYLSFWTFERAYNNVGDYVRKIIKIDDLVVFNYSINEHKILNYVNIEVPVELIKDGYINLTFGVEVVKNYTDPFFPNYHDAEYFDFYLDAISLLYNGKELIGKRGDFENYDNWSEIKSNKDWKVGLSWEKPINGEYSYRFSPKFRGNYTIGDFVYVFGNFSFEFNENIKKSSKSRKVKDKDKIYFENFQNSSNSKDKTKNIIKSNNGITISLLNTTLKEDDLKIEVIEPQNKKENTVKSFNVVALKDVENLDLKIDYLRKDNFETSLFNYNDELKKWVKVDFKQDNNSISVLNADVGIYSIIEVPIKNEEIMKVNNNLTSKSNQKNLYNNNSSSNNNNFLFYGCIFIFIIIVLIYLKIKKNNNKNIIIKKIEKSNKEELIYNSVKKYVKMYKNKFSKEEIYRALVKANIPIKNINKVLDEEY